MDSNIEGYKFKKEPQKQTMYFIHTIEPTSAVMVRLYFLHIIYRNSNMFRSMLNIFRNLLNISKAYKNSNVLATKTSTWKPPDVACTNNQHITYI
jgi:hypothetical protein